MMNNYWAYQKASQSFRKSLHKRLASTYNRKIFFDENKSSKLSSLENVEDNVSPIIQIKSVTFHPEEDGKKHHTYDYDLMQDHIPVPVFRRGQPFSMTLHFNRQYNPDEDFFHLLSEYGPLPSLANGTKYKIPSSAKEPENHDVWQIWSNGVGGAELKLQVQTPSNCQVGIWKFTMFTYKENTPGHSRYVLPQEIYILFNPWNEHDDVYLENEAERQGYVLNDSGKIWMGTNKAPLEYNWVYGQYDLVVLPAVALLLEQSDVPHSDRGSPVLIARALTAVVNHKDEDGLLEGKWKGEFDDGTKPFAWTGSVALFEEFLQSGRPVKYAQCWIFSGALTTACRALGIPCRSVTCYVCAHDTNNSLTVDKFFNKKGKKIEGGADGDCYDSTWNFHCWNDVWMNRPDLPPGYGGWQAIDGTPQEESNCKYRTGPSSLNAVKQGNIGFLYDTGFIFSEVNADLCHFVEDKNSPWGYSRIKLDTQFVGKRIVTESLSANARGEKTMEDITNLYKDIEGSEAEREAVFNALRGHPKAQKYYKAVNTSVVRDVFFKFREIDRVFVGDSFSISLTIENHAAVQRTVTASLSAIAVIYTGKPVETIKEGDVEITLQPKEAKTVRITVTAEEYKSKMGNNTQVKIMVVANVPETNQTFSAEDDFEIVKQKLEIKAPGEIKVGNVSELQFSFTNPFAESLTNCELTIEGPGLKRPKTVKLSNVPPNGQIKHTESLIPNKHGPRALVATFNSDQLSSVKGYKNIVVEQ